MNCTVKNELRTREEKQPEKKRKRSRNKLNSENQIDGQ